jgi:hypothetical protein
MNEWIRNYNRLRDMVRMDVLCLTKHETRVTNEIEVTIKEVENEKNN